LSPLFSPLLPLEVSVRAAASYRCLLSQHMHKRHSAAVQVSCGSTSLVSAHVRAYGSLLAACVSSRLSSDVSVFTPGLSPVLSRRSCLS
jgi:hypothetical protein